MQCQFSKNLYFQYKIQIMSVEDDSNEQDCTVYIEQLKSDNASLKLNAASKLMVIGATLGHNRIRDELIPYIIEIIQQMDNQNEFLIKLAEGLLELKDHCRSLDQSYILIPPLKILASLDQPAVREQAVISLKKLADDQSFTFFKKHLFPLIQQLSEANGPYSPRVSACGLIPTCYPNLQSDKQQQLNQIFKRLALKEDSPLVRRALSQNIEPYSRVVSKNISKVDLLQIWQAFIVDKIDIIKIKALEIAVIIARFFKKDQIYQKFFKLVKGVDPNRKSWRIRYALAECLASLLPYLEKDVIKKDVVEIYEQLLKDSEAQVRCIALLKSAEIAQKLSHQHSYTVFFQYIQKAASDSSLNVKLAVVEVIVPYLNTVEKQKVVQSGIPLIQTLLKDQNATVRSGVIQRLKDLHSVLDDEGTKKYLIPMIESALNDKKWRFKLALAQSITGLFKQLGYDQYKDFINKVLNTFIKDHYFAVRQATIKCLVQLKGFFGSQKILEIVSNMTKSLLKETNYIYRSTGCWLFIYSAECLDKKDFNELFLDVCKNMEGQKVSNVLISFLSNYHQIKGSLNNQSKKQFQVLARKLRDEKDDQDVLYYLAKADE